MATNVVPNNIEQTNTYMYMCKTRQTRNGWYWDSFAQVVGDVANMTTNQKVSLVEILRDG